MLEAVSINLTENVIIKGTFVHESMYDQFVEKAVKKAESLKVGNPLDPTTGIIVFPLNNFFRYWPSC